MTNQHLVNPHLDGEPFFWHGSETGVLLLHGLTATPAEVRLLAERLRDEGYTVTGPLLPGHGTSPEDLNRTGWPDWLAAATRAYKQLQQTCEHVFVGGESTGGALALYMATQFPEIAGILSYAPAIKLSLSRVDVVKMHVVAPFITSVPKQSIDANENWQGFSVNPLKAVISLRKLGRETIRRLDQIRQPVLVVQGRLDTTVHPSAGDIILSGVRSTLTEHVWMERSSHVVILDRELDEVAQLTLDFMRRALAVAAPSSQA